MGQQGSSQSSLSSMESGGAVNLETQELTWWCRILIKLISGIAGIVGFVTGIFASISVSICIVAGILQIAISLLLLVFELPFCCTYVEITKPVASFAERRTFFQKALIYGGLAIIPFAMCPSLSTLIGCGVIFATGVFYGLLALGRKADRSVMMARAAGDQADLVSNDQLGGGTLPR